MPIMPETEVKLVSVDMLREAIAEGRRWRACADKLASALRGVAGALEGIGGFERSVEELNKYLARYYRLKEGS